MDFIRSAYRRGCRFTQTGSVGTIEWSFAQPGAQFFPLPNVFLSLNFTDRKERPTDASVPGEVLTQPTVWRPGTPLSNATGETFLGSEADWLGLGTDLSPPGRPLDGEGLPLDCQPVPVGLIAQPVVGVRVQGAAVLSAPPRPLTANIAVGVSGSGAIASSVALTGTLSLEISAIGSVELLSMFHAGLRLQVGGQGTPGGQEATAGRLQVGVAWRASEGLASLEQGSFQLGVNFAGETALTEPIGADVDVELSIGATVSKFAPPLGMVRAVLRVGGNVAFTNMPSGGPPLAIGVQGQVTISTKPA